MTKLRRRPMTQERLERAAYHYLERFASSRAHFERVLAAKVRRANEDFAPPTAEQQGWIAAIAGKMAGLGLLDDTAYAQAKARSLHARGKPRRSIARWLMARGVAADTAEQALAQLAEDSGGGRTADLEAAAQFARRRRFGPWRRGSLDADRRNREIAAFARAGFAYGIARAVVGAADEAALAALGEEARDIEIEETP